MRVQTMRIRRLPCWIRDQAPKGRLGREGRRHQHRRDTDTDDNGTDSDTTDTGRI
jgi:hypothetical protein